MKKIIFFDTNAFYNYVGRSNITNNPSFVSAITIDEEKLKNECNGNIKSLCSCSVMEMMTRFRNDKNAIKNIINSINDNKFLISTVGPSNCNMKDLINKIDESLTNDNDKEYQQTMDGITMEKAKMEANWVYTFAAEISLCYVILISKDLDQERQEQLIDLYSKIAVGQINEKKKHISETLFEAYKLNSEKKTAKDAFYNTIWEYCLTARTLFECYKKETEGKTPNEIKIDDIIENVKRDILPSTADNKKEIADVIIDIFKNDTNEYNKLLDNLISKFNGKDKMDELQSSYIKVILDKLFKVNVNDKSQEFRKNDIIDMIILGAISTKIIESIKENNPKINISIDDLYLITFDNCLLEQLNERYPDKYKFVQQFYI